MTEPEWLAQTGLYKRLSHLTQWSFYAASGSKLHTGSSLDGDGGHENVWQED